MIVSLVKKRQIYNFYLPDIPEGNYWVTDIDSNNLPRNLLNVKEMDGAWQLNSNYDAGLIVNDVIVDSIKIEINKFYKVDIRNEDDAYIFCMPSLMENSELRIKCDADIRIGSSSSCEICSASSVIDALHAKLYYRQGNWTIENSSSKFSIYVNNSAVASKKLQYGDIVFIGGLKIIVLKNHVIVNNPNHDIKVSLSIFELVRIARQQLKRVEKTEELELKLYQEKDMFYRSPRFKRSVEHIELNIDPAPEKKDKEEPPALYTIGPMLTMGMTSVVSAYNSISSVTKNGKDLSDALPSIILAVASLGTMLLWPLLNKTFQKNKTKKEEKLRQKKYKEYIDLKRDFIKTTIELQSKIIKENNPTYEELKQRIMLVKPNLWERTIEHDDFMTLNIGTGVVPVDIKINYPEEHFSLQEDNLKKILSTLVNESKDINNSPIEVNFIKKYISAIVGPSFKIQKFFDGLMLQMLTYHGYDELKTIIFTTEENKNNWAYAKKTPHIWSDDKATRFFASDINEMKQVSAFLEKEFQYREESKKSDKDKLPRPYYLLIIDCYKIARDIEIIKNILDYEGNNGFGIIILNNNLSDLPKECMHFICISTGEKNEAGVFENELISTKQKEIIPLIDYNLDLTEVCTKLANIPMQMDSLDTSLPNSISFLEMYNVGNIDQLNILSRWKNNNPIKTLHVPVGVDKFGQLFNLDVHEKFHGPHGLIAGSTGSGKSEFIITFILSLAVNFRPEEVAFVLIDYKGGGLAGAFDNKETGIKLPHIAGTITNLDTNEMNRSLASINSELKRRQKAFNDARQKTNESTIDIYKYQQLYRDGVVSEPIPHLLIISDEFAELKSQQPEFMDNLISTARIGRSLGVHLILATQKPSGVVNDQIWSNSKFKVCLKVQEKSDSMDMIKVPDAASLKQTGRFYLQVGYNEYFALGQSAWCGAKYLPSEKVKKKIDNSIQIKDNIGYVMKKYEDEIKLSSNENHGEQIKNIIDYIINIAKENSSVAKKLWLDKIPSQIIIRDLENKYGFKKTKDVVAIVGEYDDPSTQSQSLLKYNVNNDGNVVITGISGSGKSLLIEAIIYSTIIKYSAIDINYYIIDLGGEILGMFKEAPQVGDFIVATDSEKIINLFKMLNSELEKRKDLLKDYNGNYNTYSQKVSDKKIPLMVIIINNYEAFQELYNEFEEQLVSLTREGNKVGIVFIISQNSTNTLKYKIKQNFKVDYVLQLNDDHDYSSLVGKTNGLSPTKTVGRGLVNLGKVLEFQTAYAYKADEMTDFIKVLCEKLSTISEIKAPKVPVLPEKLPFTYFDNNYDITCVPIGIKKETLEVSKWNFIKNYITIISGIEQPNVVEKSYGLLHSIIRGKTQNVVFDALKAFENRKFENTIYLNKNFEDTISQLNSSISQLNEQFINGGKDSSIFDNNKKVICIIIGIIDFLNKISEEVKKEFFESLKIAKEFGVYSFIIIDSFDSFSEFAYEDWYKKTVNNNYGIWLGNGITDQSTIKCSRVDRKYSDGIEEGYGFAIERGNVSFIKVVEEELNEQ